MKTSGNINIREGTMKRLFVFSFVVSAFIAVAGLHAHGTTAGTVISNARTLGQLNSLLAGPGQISAVCTNITGATSYAMVIGTIATTHVDVGYDISLAPGVVGSMNGTAASFVDFTFYITNWGNQMDDIRIRLTNRAATSGWEPGSFNAFELWTNGAVAFAQNSAVDFIYPDLPSDTAVLLAFRVYIPSSMADRSTNQFQAWIDDGEPTGIGDSWPTTYALSPATPDMANNRDHQTAILTVYVQGPAIRISKTVDLTSILPYQKLTYTVFYTNAGSGSSYGLSLQDVLPDAVTNIGNIREWVNGAAVSNALTTASGDDDADVAAKTLIYRPQAGNVASNGFGTLKFEVLVK